VKEIEELKEATGLVVKHYPEAKENIALMRKQVSRIESIVDTSQLKVDMAPVRDVLHEQGVMLEKKLRKAQVFPNWLIVTFIVGCGLLAISLSGNYILYKKWEREEKFKMSWYNRAKELEGKQELE